MSYQDTPVVPDLKGNVPGLLDPSQRSRLLRRPDSTLSFASFDPNTAAPYTMSGLGDLSLDDSCRPKRIVIETRPGLGTSWRWVPRARLRSHVQDEGAFPRLVKICGQLYNISQEQWDIYKLDTLYDCFVDDFSAFSVISRKDSPSYEGSNPGVGSSHPSLWPGSSSARQTPDNQSDIDDMMEVDDDNSPYAFRPPPKRRNRSKRTPPYAFDFTTKPGVTSPPSSKKRNAFASFQNLRDPEEEEKAYFEQDNKNRNTTQFSPKDTKRARTMSPSTSQRAAHTHSNKRKRAKRKKMDKEKVERIIQRERRMEREILADILESAYSGNSYSFEDIPEDEEPDVEIFDDPPPQPEANVEEELAQAQRIAESLRKMDELNADREHQRKREKVIREEKAKGQRAQTEVPPSAQERERRAKEKREAEEQHQAEKKEEERQEKRQKAALEREQRHLTWDLGIWDNNRAIERFHQVLTFFVKAKFHADTLPLTFIDIPWPTLRHPREITVEDITWDSVREFFDTARGTIRDQEFKNHMKVCRVEFHPDSWSRRRLLAAIINEKERNEIETAVTTAAQTVNTLWNEIKGT